MKYVFSKFSKILEKSNCFLKLFKMEGVFAKRDGSIFIDFEILADIIIFGNRDFS